ncbi:aromatic ring-hydroxylating oxygenase subunit alpha [Nodularia sphaerocarpa]|uniref:aromatic ring-hydroxylating dioxygenase subunit alpha n=1 Tax=Nodularia sphaerocarpa TaxID=137816 RepID=UPI001EFAD55B|nr:aromatic ring-hydroxylating dioxygenase subunit alpha [Nodularia sphaerocarpa]MDB9374913.1 aromatic ring-hydroxylating dioxygenase subunit alpha [Nodularia sphaerocarpa CS-585]MDB9380163.1 aromatic ring-hydroxylating dioxygenase subunit alpha [Nodularia sphaerocarpa CS-585A2]ULP72736.1 Toluene-4-sulfonate monooxygenase system iron-sulfur subunit TsaM1 [Nodularia sphaerocarpa UHCC 0038]
MLKNFWYACEFSSAITKKPKQIAMLNQKFVLYRNSQGQVVALKDQCSHRGAALSMGWLEDNCIRCPYHGWKFQADGKCVQIPSNEVGIPIPKKAHVNSYPVQEKYGFVWLFYGDLPAAECPPIPPFPEYEDPKMHPIYVEYGMQTNYTRVIENALDPAHLYAVHANSFGAGFAQDPKVEDYVVKDEDGGISTKIVYKNYTQPKNGIFKSFFRPKQTQLNATTTFYLPNITKIESDFGRGKIINYAIHLPVDENTTISKRIQLRNFFTYSWADRLFVKFHHKVGLEDKVVTESQSPQLIPDNLLTEVHVPADALTLAYRQLRQKYLAMGWGLDSEQYKLDNSRHHQSQSSYISLMN